MRRCGEANIWISGNQVIRVKDIMVSGNQKDYKDQINQKDKYRLDRLDRYYR